jgi:hypothetical protein
VCHNILGEIELWVRIRLGGHPIFILYFDKSIISSSYLITHRYRASSWQLFASAAIIAAAAIKYERTGIKEK